RLFQRMAFEKLAHLGDLPQILYRDREDGEPLLPLGDDEPVRGEAGQGLPERIDADVVSSAELLELELRARRQHAEDDVLTQPLVQRFSQGRRCARSGDAFVRNGHGKALATGISYCHSERYL